MKKIKNIKRTILHNGVFHTDDVAVAAVLTLINKNIEIIRISKNKNFKNTTATLVADIGGGYFDHHNNTNSGERCSIKIIWETFKTQIIKSLNISKEVLPQFDLFINYINDQDLTGHNPMEGLEKFRDFNPTFLERGKENLYFKRAVFHMKKTFLMIIKGESLDKINEYLLFVSNLRAKAHNKAMKIAYKFLTMRNKREAEVWILPCWMPYIKLYFKEDIYVPNKIIIRTERSISVQSWNYHEIKWDEKIVPEHVHKNTCIFVKNIHDAHLCQTITNSYWF
jgi:hypothetical protein